MQSLKAETDTMLNQIKNYEATAADLNKSADDNDAVIRDLQKKIGNMESKLDETLEQLNSYSMLSS